MNLDGPAVIVSLLNVCRHMKYISRLEKTLA